MLRAQGHTLVGLTLNCGNSGGGAHEGMAEAVQGRFAPSTM